MTTYAMSTGYAYDRDGETERPRIVALRTVPGRHAGEPDRKRGRTLTNARALASADAMERVGAIIRGTAITRRALADIGVTRICMSEGLPLGAFLDYEDRA